MRSIMAGPAPLPPGARDERLDMFRGLALVMIFINHVPGTVFEYFTNRNFGFSDAAEAFVFMSGVAAGLAYSGSILKKAPLWLSVARPWARARQLYFVHLTLTFIFLGTFAAAAHYFGLFELLETNNLKALARDPLPTLIGIPLLTHQFGYLNILPLYLTLLLFTPFLIMTALKKPYWVLAGSVLVWAIAGQFRLNFPNYPNSGGWFFNPLSWQLIFVIGLLAGIGMKTSRRFFPVNPLAFLLALGFLILTIFWMKVKPVGAMGNGFLTFLWKSGFPFYIHSFDKTFLSLPRLLHALCLFYVLASIPAMQTIAASRWVSPLRVMGRQGLAVFSTGTALSLFFQAVKAGTPASTLTDALILIVGLGIQVGLAYALTDTVKMRAGEARTKAVPTGPVAP
ncbi:OpgC domain-containing protein [Devosia sp. Leaf64]|uniref:OpgC family protein n=1 Tax=Devosia sp. Leaf64 TaxID=1736229 RepID=UPI00191085F8|nr:OpgC domain-containing protein [Devosia sp. Leaf64]